MHERMVRLVLGGESGDRSRRRIAHRRAAKPLFLRAQAAGEASADLAFIDVPRLVGAIAVAAVVLPMLVLYVVLRKGTATSSHELTLQAPIPALSAAAKKALARLARTVTRARSVTCTADTDAHGTAARDLALTRKQAAAACAYLRAQGAGRTIRAVHGLDRVSESTRSLVVEAKVPEPGRSAADTYEGDGHVVVRHPDTATVEAALAELITTIHVETG